ncbi:MAG: DUF350 domain-containing protein [Candidatus Anstonellales archaeon]
MTFFVLALVLSVLKIVLSLLFSVAAVYFAIRFFDYLTKGIDEWKEIAKGNIAVSIYLAAFIFTVSLIIEPSLGKLSLDIANIIDKLSIAVLIFFVFDLLALVITIIISALVLYIALHLIDALSHGMKKFEQLKKGNVAVAITLAAILIAIGFIIRQGVSIIMDLLNPFNFFVFVG